MLKKFALFLSILTLFSSSNGFAQVALVSVDAVVSQKFTQTVPIIGRLLAKQSGVVATLTNGPVAEILVKPGDVVSEGQVLAQLSTKTLELRRKQAEYQLNEARARLKTANAQLRLAGQEVKRLEGLKGSAAVSKAAYDDALQQQNIAYSRVAESEAGINSSTANLDIAALDFSHGSIRAPYNGTITEKLTEVGSFLQVGQPVFRMISDKRLELEVDVPSFQVNSLPIGFNIEISLENGTRHNANVRAIIPEENPRTRTRRVRFEPHFDTNKGLLANEQSVTAFIPAAAIKQVLTVHKDGLIRRGNNDFVYVVVKSAEEGQPDTTEFRQLTIGLAVDERVEVESGLAEGELVVIRGNERIQPGQAITISGSQ